MYIKVLSQNSFIYFAPVPSISWLSYSFLFNAVYLYLKHWLLWNNKMKSWEWYAWKLFLIKPWNRIEHIGINGNNVLKAAVLPILRECSIVIPLSGKGLIIFTLYSSALKPLSCQNMLRNLLCKHSSWRIPCVNRSISMALWNPTVPLEVFPLIFLCSDYIE